MAVRQKVNTRNCAVTERMITTNGQILSDTTSYYPSSVVGSKEYIDSVDSGRFVPGIFRVNPVVIAKASVSSPSWKLSSKPFGSTPCGHGIYWEEEGDLLGVYAAQTWPSFTTSPWKASYAEQSAIRAYAKFSEADWDIGTELGELSETLQLLKHPLQNVVDWYHQLLKKRWRGLSDGVDLSTSLWMQYRYGFMPLYYSVMDIIGLVNRGIVRADKSLHKKKGTLKDRTICPAISYASTGVGSFSFDIKTVEEWRIRYTTNVYYTYNQEYNWTLILKQLGLDPFGVPALVWELTTLSFVWDWFLGVGDWLRAITPNPAITTLGSCTSAKLSYTSQSSASNVRYCSGYGPYMIPSPTTSVNKKMERLERRVGTPVPVTPVLQSRIINLKRTLDSLSIIWGKLPRKFRRF